MPTRPSVPIAAGKVESQSPSAEFSAPRSNSSDGVKMEIVENQNPCGPKAALMTVLGIAGAALGFFCGVVGAAKLIGRTHPPVR